MRDQPGPTVLITGVTGQDGIYLARLLRRRGARVVGVAPAGAALPELCSAYLADVELATLDICDREGVRSLVTATRPDEVYNLAAVSSVARSWDEPEITRAVNHEAVETLVDALVSLRADTGHESRFFQASSAEVLGSAAHSPYARAKAAAEDVVREARERKGLHASSARLYNHESPLRTTAFVTGKITRAVAEIVAGVRSELRLGNLDVSRDWGFAGDYVEAMHRMVAADEPQDLPIGTGRAHRLADLLATAFEAAGVDDPARFVVSDPDLLRPADTAVLVADPEPAAAALGWRATTTFADLVRHMVAVDRERVRTGVDHDARYLEASALQE
ncbi:GDP-mannose 4,6-dehydratase [Nocardioides sp. HM23]|uniref:GDP-mannose 4,6-dehydratase n=1 Tax=Nocardioides bizhenqiangii TaxID=3095076 RepID=UPI002ACABA47|nr:GDP-mannose 4,6-dehydratase [Nocardioides sp. HM23]MDZ5619997.1 GDP-mannose 4,6-dehydratase [Nocardioides sp. HM23]